MQHMQMIIKAQSHQRNGPPERLCLTWDVLSQELHAQYRAMVDDSAKQQAATVKRLKEQQAAEREQMQRSHRSPEALYRPFAACLIPSPKDCTITQQHRHSSAFHIRTKEPLSPCWMPH